MIALVRIALQRPYTFVVLALLILIVGPLAALRTPVDIFPEIRIPDHRGRSGSTPACRRRRWRAAWSRRIQRVLTTTVNDIEHIEATSYTGLGIVKVFFQPGADIRIANAQVTAVSQTVLSTCRPDATPPLILNYNASTVPIIQLALSGNGLSEQQLADIGLNIVRIAADHRAGRGNSLSVRRQVAAGADRSRSGRDAGARPVRPGCRERARRAEPDHAGRNRKDRQFRIRDPAQQRAVASSASSATCRSRPSTARWSISTTSPRCATATRRRPISCMSTAAVRC